MDCMWLKGKETKQCGAVDSSVVLSGCELEEFCTSGDYESCPVYKARERLGDKRLSVKQYYLVYSSWTRHAVPLSMAMLLICGNISAEQMMEALHYL